MDLSLIFNSFFKALGQIGDPRFRKVLWLGLGLTIALLFVIYWIFLAVLQWIGLESFIASWVGDSDWIGSALGVTSFLMMAVLSIFLMVPVASAITSMFLDQVAQAVEDRHYPHLHTVPSLPLSEAVMDTISFLGLLIGANILALLLYLALPPLAPFIFWGLNGFLLGREYFTLAAMRRLGRENARVLRKRHRATIWAAGTLMAIPLSIPLVNLIIPIMGAATFTHIFHGIDHDV